jgi:hypothetical protein
MRSKWWLKIALVVCLSAVAFTGCDSDNDDQDVEVQDENNDTNNDTNNDINNGEVTTSSVTVADQTADPANQVVVAQVVAAQDSFIAIHEDDGDGGIGGVIGVSALLTKGTSSDVVITLDRDAVEGETLYAMLHSDSNENGVYEFPADGLDGPVADEDGEVIAPAFTVSVEGGEGVIDPVVIVADQTADPANQVVIDSATTPTDGFIAIHEDDGAGGIGGVIGVSALLTQGSNNDILITLDRDAVDGETLYAMLHSDSNGNGVYEFPTDDLDGPVFDEDGEVVAPAFTVSVEGDVMPVLPSVTVADQTADPANQVVIAEVVNPADGFIVIHEDDGAGGIGGVIGASALLEAGTSTDVVVTLDREAVDGETLYAMLHSDSNGNGVYEFPTDGLDGPVLDIDDAVIAPAFTVSVEAVMEEVNTVTVEDQLATPADQVTIAEVVNANDGFVVIHEDDGAGGIGGVIGASELLEAGSHIDVVITLDRAAVDGETLYAMLHSDSNGNGVYEFPTDGLDGPVLDADEMVIAPPFMVSVLGESSVMVESQVADPSNRVVIGQVNTAVNGFIAVHEDNGEGGIGGVIGVSGFLEAGMHSDVTVALDQSVTDGKLLFAMLHEDVDDNGFYNFPGPDGPVLDANDLVIAPPFYAFLPEFADAVFVMEQTAEPANQVWVSAVATTTNGFIVIHEDDGEGGIGGVIGASALLEAGVHAHVPVTLDRDAVHNETLYAMLHTDSNDNGVYEFPTDGLDGPVLDFDDNVIAPPFVVGLNLVDGVTAEDQDASEFPNQVVIAQVTNAANGFIAIHEDDGNGGIGGVIGVSAFLPEGMHTDVPVTLERNANDGETLYAMLHVDGDDNGIYEFPMVAEDGPVLDGDGAVIAPGFEVSVANQVHVMDQIPGGGLINSTVVIDQVIYNGGGFIAIHEDNGEGGIGGVIGVSNYLPAGTNTEVTIEVDRFLVANETLYAMLHTDADSDTAYTFPGPDGPVLDEEGVVIAPSFVTQSRL